MNDITVVQVLKERIVVEDIQFGVGGVQQVRGGITKQYQMINASHIPMKGDPSLSIEDVLNDAILATNVYDKAEADARFAFISGSPAHSFDVGLASNEDHAIPLRQAYLLTSSTFRFVGSWTPTVGDEYPDTGGQSNGALWLIEGVDESTGYTYVAGDLLGKTVHNNDHIIWNQDSDSWTHSVQDSGADVYYARDGSKPMLGNIPMSGYRVTGMGAGVDLSDAVTLRQVQDTFLPLDGSSVMTGDLVSEANIEADSITVNNVAVVTVDEVPVSVFPDDEGLALVTHASGNVWAKILGLPVETNHKGKSVTTYGVEGDSFWSYVNYNPIEMSSDQVLQAGVSASVVGGFTILDGVTLTIPDESVLAII